MRSMPHVKRENGLTTQTCLACPDSASIQGWVSARAAKLVTTIAWKRFGHQNCQCSIQKLYTHIAAISFTPKHFLTSCTIILIFPPSPLSPESGTEMGASSSGAVSCAAVLIMVGERGKGPLLAGGDGRGTNVVAQIRIPRQSSVLSHT